MHYLGLALYAEGSTDYHFLCPLLLRLCESVCAQADQPVEIGGVLPLDDSHAMRTAPRSERIAQAAQDAAGAWNLLFVHADADGDADRALRERVAPGLGRVRDAARPHAEGVAVVPVQQTEAWVLADGDALRAVFGSTLTDSALGLPAQLAAIERLAEPKLALEAAFLATRPTGRRARAGATPLFNALGEQVALDRLRALPSFRALELGIQAALQRLQILK